MDVVDLVGETFAGLGWILLRFTKDWFCILDRSDLTHERAKWIQMDHEHPIHTIFILLI